MIYIPELNFGNLRTLEAFLGKLNLNFCNKKISELKDIERGILLIPGNGNWDSYIKSDIVNLIKSKKEMIFIGICGGFQIFFQNSEESSGEGASLIAGNVIKLSNITPTIGYLKVEEYGEMYFSNSYGVPFKENKDIDAKFYQYYEKKYLACFKYKNIIGFQFHPEVSGKLGEEVFLKYIKHLNIFNCNKIK